MGNGCDPISNFTIALGFRVDLCNNSRKATSNYAVSGSNYIYMVNIRRILGY
jgi:hypothetical protein